MLAETEPEILWRPNPGPQTRFLSSRASECLYGGAAGGGKSAASIALPLRWVDNPRFRCLFLRRESKYLADAVDKSEALYPKLGAIRHKTTNVWTFPSGATVWLNHCEHESDISNYDSLEFHLVIWEELTHFTEKQYRGINARIRGTDPTLPRASRATCNPGGVGHDWVFKRFGAWLDPGAPVKADAGQVLWYRGDELVPKGTSDALSRTFIPAMLTDNPHITPDYRAQLMQLDPVRREQLLAGNWLIKPAAGLYFKRTWIKEWLDAPPAKPSARIRYWDLAAGGDFAAGCRYSRAAPLWVMEGMEHLRGTPHQVRQLVFATAARDGKSVPIWIEQDPGQAGKDQAFSYTSAPELQGYTVRFRPKRIDKIRSFEPVASQAEAGLVAFVRGAWNMPVIEEAEGFPDGDYDDQCDAWSGAHAVLTGRGGETFAAAMNNLFKKPGT